MTQLVSLSGVSKIYSSGDEKIYALRDVDLIVHRGDYLALQGPSGSGKTTLMNIIGCLDQPTIGTYKLGGEDIGNLGDHALAGIRSKRIGFVFQSFNLIPRISALANVERALIYRGVTRHLRSEMARDALARVGLANRFHHLPSELSGGQRQRVAIARALSGNPELLIADEPTGNLDAHSAHQVLSLFDSLSTQGATIIVVTHDQTIAKRCQRQVTLDNGQIKEFT